MEHLSVFDKYNVSRPKSGVKSGVRDVSLLDDDDYYDEQVEQKYGNFSPMSPEAVQPSRGTIRPQKPKHAKKPKQAKSQESKAEVKKLPQKSVQELLDERLMSNLTTDQIGKQDWPSMVKNTYTLTLDEKEEKREEKQRIKEEKKRQRQQQKNARKQQRAVGKQKPTKVKNKQPKVGSKKFDAVKAEALSKVQEEFNKLGNIDNVDYQILYIDYKALKAMNKNDGVDAVERLCRNLLGQIDGLAQKNAQRPAGSQNIFPKNGLDTRADDYDDYYRNGGKDDAFSDYSSIDRLMNSEQEISNSNEVQSEVQEQPAAVENDKFDERKVEALRIIQEEFNKLENIDNESYATVYQMKQSIESIDKSAGNDLLIALYWNAVSTISNVANQNAERPEGSQNILPENGLNTDPSAYNTYYLDGGGGFDIINLDEE